MRSFLLLLLSLLTLETVAQLSGHYTIDPNGSGSNNFTTVNAAVSILETQGVNAHVTFFIAEGVYLEQVTLDAIPGTSDTSTVTFTADTNNTAEAIIRHTTACDSNWVVRLTNADWVTFDNLTIQNSATNSCHTVFDVRGGTEHLTISNCEVKAEQVYLQSGYLFYSNGDNNHIVLSDNHFYGATYGLYLWSPAFQGSEGFSATGNLFENQNYNTIAVIRYQDVVFDQNEITCDSGQFYYASAIYMSQCRGVQVTNNRIHSSSNSGYRYGMLVYNCENPFLERGLIANNCVLTGVDANTTLDRGAIVISNSSYFDVVHNTFNVRSNSPNSIGLNLYTGALNRFYNNIVRMGAGHVVDQYASTAAFSGNHNAFYSPDSLAFYYYTASGDLDFEGWSALTNTDTNSLLIDPSFANELECTTCDTALDNAGTPTGLLEDDLNGYLRSTVAPDIGATEYFTTGNFALEIDPVQCQDSLRLEVAGAAVQWWINGTNTQDPQPWIHSNCEPSIHAINVSASNATCGVADDSLTVTLVPHPNLGGTAHLCSKEEMVLTPCGENSSAYQWSTAQTTRFITVKDPGTYTVTKTELGCTYVDSVVITQSDSLMLPSYAEHCLHDAPIVYDASLEHAVAYYWTGGSAPFNAINDFDSTGVYSVQVLDSFGCTDSAAINLTVLDTPEAVISVDENNWLDYEYDALYSLGTSALTTYYWQFEIDDVPISSSVLKEVSMTFTQDIVGKEVKARLWVDNGCGTGYAEHTFEIPVGISETKDSPMMVFPNPVREGAQFSCPTCTEPYEITLTDAAGRVQRQVSVINPTSYWLERDGLPAGVYFYEVHSGSSTMTSGKLVLVP